MHTTRTILRAHPTTLQRRCQRLATEIAYLTGQLQRTHQRRQELLTGTARKRQAGRGSDTPETLAHALQEIDTYLLSFEAILVQYRTAHAHLLEASGSTCAWHRPVRGHHTRSIPRPPRLVPAHEIARPTRLRPPTSTTGKG